MPTVYAGFATKADFLRRAIEVATAGDDAPIPVAQRPTAQWVADTDEPVELLRRYAVACGEMVERIGRIYAVLTVAADADPMLADLLATFETQRLTAAAFVVAAVRDRGGLSEGADLDHARDVVWMANSPEVYSLSVKRGWPNDRYVAFVRGFLVDLVIERDP